jgi:hypothetical protein
LSESLLTLLAARENSWVVVVLIRHTHQTHFSLTNTGAQPFACSSCQRRFNRMDSLTRHERIHKRNPQAHSPTTWATNAPSLDNATLASSAPDSTTSSPQNAIGDQSVFVDSASLPDCFNDIDTTLAWPDSQFLLENIISTNWNTLAFPPQYVSAAQDLPEDVFSEMVERHTAADSTDVTAVSGGLSSNPSREAIMELRNVMTSLVGDCVRRRPAALRIYADSASRLLMLHPQWTSHHT